MNVTYKLIKNKNGHTVVASELAKGHKKNTRMAISALLLTSLVSIGSAGIINLGVISGGEYTSGTLEKNGTNFTIKDSDNGSLNGNGYDGRKTHIINGSTDSIKFGNATVKRVDTGGFIKTLNFTSMWEDGYVKLYKKDGANLIPLTDLPTWPTLNFQKTENFTWVSNNGELRTIRIYSLDNEDMTTGSPGQFEEIILVEQPPVPYYKFNVATVLNGEMNLDDTQDKLDWFFGQIKQSNIFSAISNTAGKDAKIIVGTNDPNESVSMTMTFFPGYMTTDSGTVVSSKQEFGPSKAYAGTFKNPVLATALGLASDDFTVTNIAELRDYQNQITMAISNNLILEGTFDHHFNMAMVSKSLDEYLAEVEYDATIDRDDLYLTNYFGEATGRNSILKADGDKATIEIKANAKLKAYYGQIAHGMNNAIITNYATIALGDNSTYGNMMSNLYLTSNAEYYNKGTLIYGYQPKDGYKDGVWIDQANHLAFVDIVQNATFYNDNEMFVGGYHSQAFNTANKIPLSFNGLGEIDIRSAVNISGKDALFHNRVGATMYIGSMDIVNGSSSDNTRSIFSNGVSVHNGANWINEGKIYVGKKLDDKGDLVNSNITYHLYDVLRENDYLLNQTNNAVFANISSATEDLSIVNKGEITIGSAMKDLSTDYIQNGAAINIEYRNDKDPTQVEKINVVNEGIINVGGYHSVGMRFYGQIGSKQGTPFLGNNVGGVINVTGSNNVGVMAANGAIAYNRGIINVGDPNASGGIISALFNRRAYGVRAEDATVYIDGTSSQINLVGDHSVGVHARVGGKVELTGNVTMNPTSGAKTNLVYYWISGRKALSNGQFQSSEIKFAPGNVILSN